MTYHYNRQHKELTPDTLLNSGLYMKINFDQAREIAGAIDENTGPIIGYEYIRGYEWYGKNRPDKLVNVSILGTGIDERSQPFVTYQREGDDTPKRYSETFWNSDMQHVGGIYVLSPQGKMILENEKEVMDLSVNPKYQFSKVPVEMVNKILVNNNPHYVNKKKKPLAAPLSEISVKGGKRRSTRSKKNRKQSKRRENNKRTTRRSRGGVARPPGYISRNERTDDDAVNHPMIVRLRNVISDGTVNAVSQSLLRAYTDYEVVSDVYLSTSNPHDGYGYGENYFIAIEDLTQEYLQTITREEFLRLYGIIGPILNDSEGHVSQNIQRLNSDERLIAAERIRMGDVYEREIRRATIILGDTYDLARESFFSSVGGKRKSKHKHRKVKKSRKGKQTRKRKRRQRGGQPDEIQEGTRDYVLHRRMFLQQLKYSENDKKFKENVIHAIDRYNTIIDEMNHQLPDKGHTKKMPRLSKAQMIEIYNDVERKIMTDFNIDPQEFEVNLDIFDS